MPPLPLPPDAGFGPALRALRAAQKSPHGVSAYSIYVNRPAGRVLAALAHRLGATPNQVSVLSGVCSAACGLLVATGPASVPVGLAVGLGLALAFALDSADGQLARLRGSGNPAGEWLDHMIDCATKLGLHAAVLVAWYRSGITGAPLGLPLVFQAATVLLFFGGILTGKVRERSAEALTRRRTRPLAVTAVLLLPVDHGALCCLFLTWGRQGLFTCGYAAFCLLTVVGLLGLATSWFRELSR